MLCQARPVANATRRSRAELRAVLLDVGVNLLFKRGLVGGAEHVTFTDVFAEAESRWGSAINPASVYKRIWKDQSEFQRDVLLAAASFYPDPDGEGLPALKVAREFMTTMDVSTPETRARALSEVCRVAAQAHLEMLEASRPWQIWVGIWALTVSTPTTDDDEMVGPSIHAGNQKATQSLQALLEEVVPAVGYGISSPFSFEQLALTVGALAEGIALRNRFAQEHLMWVDRAAGFPGAPVDHGSSGLAGDPGGGADRSRWTLFGVAFEALVLQFCAPVPHFRP